MKLFSIYNEKTKLDHFHTSEQLGDTEKARQKVCEPV